MRRSRRPEIDQTLTTSSRTKWIQHWAKVICRIWPSYWLLICGTTLVVGSVAMTWLEFPYSFNVGGWELPVQNIVPHIHEFSYGLCGIAVLAVAFALSNAFGGRYFSGLRSS